MGSYEMDTIRLNLHYLARTLLFALPAVLFGIQISYLVFCCVSVERERSVDFRAYYSAAKLVRLGRIDQLYDLQELAKIQADTVSADGDTHLFIHPAYEVWVLAPMAWLSFHHAYLSWVGLNALLLAVIVRLLHDDTRELRRISPALPTLLILGFLPVAQAVTQGQDSILLLLCVCGAWRLLRENRWFWCGFVLSLGSFRFQYLLLFFVLFAAWKCWRFVVGYAAGSWLTFLMSVGTTGYSGQLQYLSLLWKMGHATVAMPGSYDDRVTQPLLYMVNLRGLLAGLHIHANALALTAAGVLLAWLVGRRMERDRQFLFVTTVGCILSYHCFGHDLTVLVLPLLLLTGEAVAQADYLALASLGIFTSAPVILALWGRPTDNWLLFFCTLGLAILIARRGVLESYSRTACRIRPAISTNPV